MVFGREGAYVLVNGRSSPRLRARSGAPQRWRIVNTAKSRFFYLDLEGQAFTVIGGDGGLAGAPSTTDMLLITPGERVDVIVTPTGKPGHALALRAMLYNRGYGSVEYRSVEDAADDRVHATSRRSRDRAAARSAAQSSRHSAEGATRVDSS